MTEELNRRNIERQHNDYNLANPLKPGILKYPLLNTESRTSSQSCSSLTSKTATLLGDIHDYYATTYPGQPLCNHYAL